MNEAQKTHAIEDAKVHQIALMAATEWASSEMSRSDVNKYITPENFAKEVAAVYLTTAKELIASSHCEAAS